LWKIESQADSGFNRFVIPPASLAQDQHTQCKAAFASASPHDLFHVVQALKRTQA
jgi:hypothetical protein